MNDSVPETIKTIARRRGKIIMQRNSPSKSPPARPPTSVPALLQVDTNESILQQHFRNAYKLSKIKKISPSKAHKTEGDIDMPAASLCNLCSRKDDACINLQQNHAIVLTVSDITRFPSWDIRQILASVCSRCLVYISAINESSSKLRMRCEQAMQSQSIVLAPPTPDTSPNNFMQVSTSLLDDTLEHSNIDEQQQQRQCYAPGYCDETAMPLATSISPPHQPLPACSSSLPLAIEDLAFETMSRSPSSTNAGQNSMLSIHYEQPVSPLNTESGGGGTNRKRSYQRIQIIPVQMICSHCNRAYWRKDYYRKHMRRCSAKYRNAKSVMTQRSRSVSRLQLDAMSLASEGNEQITTPYQPRIYHCNACTVTVDSRTKLNQHKRIHLPHYYCDICNSDYTSQNDYEFHRAQCSAKMEVLQKAKTECDPKIPEQPARRLTRSYSRAISLAPSLAPSIIATASMKKIKAKEKAKAKSISTANKNVSKPTDNEDEQQSTITECVKTHKFPYSDVNQTISLNSDEEDDDDDEDEEDDDVSEVDTLYSKRLSLTNQWVEDHSTSSHSHLSQSGSYLGDSMEDIPFPSFKEYDLYLLDRLKSEISAHIITCFVPDCRYSCETLKELMIHDYMYHYKKPWFRCYKCGFSFTSKVFLDYHLDLQNKGRYVCYKCGGHFEYQHQLDRHLIQHNRLALQGGGEKYICYFCNFKFLDEDKLLTHCRYENHHWNERRPTIEIDQSMTVSNKVPQKSWSECNNNKNYQVKILNMVLKKLPTKRCTPMEKYRFHLPPYLRIQHRIGQVEFRYPTNPNCVGCL